MSRKKFYEIKPEIRNGLLGSLYQIISEIKDKQDARKFLTDLLTPGESIMIAYRIEIAKMLLKGFGYRDIQKKLKVSSGTINNVNRWLHNGFGGYMKELKKAKNQKERRNVIPKNEWEAIKKKYPAHFFIFNLMDKLKK
jgi:TrpR-related protein YerC/YecD